MSLVAEIYNILVSYLNRVPDPEERLAYVKSFVIINELVNSGRMSVEDARREVYDTVLSLLYRVRPDLFHPAPKKLGGIIPSDEARKIASDITTKIMQRIMMEARYRRFRKMFRALASSTTRISGLE